MADYTDQEDDEREDSPNIPGALTKGTGLVGSDDDDGSPSPMNDTVKNYLMQKQAQLAGAQDQSKQNVLAAGLARAGGTLSRAIAGAKGPMDETGFNALDKNADAPVQDMLDQQKAQKTALDEEKTQKEMDADDASRDPDSDASKEFRATMKANFPQIAAAYGDDFNNLSASDSANVFKVAETKAKLDENLLKSRQLSQDRAMKYENAANDKHEKYVQHIEDTAKGFRSDPASLRFDAMIGAATTGKAMIDKYRGREDEMPIQDIHALVSDRLKAISGATPTEKEIEAQMPPSLRGATMHPIDTMLGHQHAAEAGDFVRNIDAGFREMDKTAYQGLMDRQKSVVNSPRLSDDERQRISSIAMPKRAYADTPQTQYAPDVLKYAQDHNIAPDQANAIKLKRGGK